MIPIEERIATFLANTRRDDKATALLAEAATAIRRLRPLQGAVHESVYQVPHNPDGTALVWDHLNRHYPKE